MRQLLLAALIAASPAAAFAACPTYTDDAASHNIQNQTALALCQQAELGETVRRQAQQLKFEADLQARLTMLELERRMNTPVVMPEITLPSF